MRQQAQAFVRHVRKTRLGAVIVMHDRDSKFTSAFDEVLEHAGLRPMKRAHRSPNTVVFVERFIQTLQREVLDYFVLFGEQHMNYLCSVFVDYYHLCRPHQSKNNEVLVKRGKRKTSSWAPGDVPPVADIRCEQQLGGLLKHYYRKVASGPLRS